MADGDFPPKKLPRAACNGAADLVADVDDFVNMLLIDPVRRRFRRVVGEDVGADLGNVRQFEFADVAYVFAVFTNEHGQNFDRAFHAQA